LEVQGLRKIQQGSQLITFKYPCLKIIIVENMSEESREELDPVEAMQSCSFSRISFEVRLDCNPSIPYWHRRAKNSRASSLLCYDSWIHCTPSLIPL